MKKIFLGLMIFTLLLISGANILAQDQPFRVQEAGPTQQETQLREEFNKIFNSLNESEKIILKQHDAFNDALNLKNREEISAEEYYQRIIKTANDVKTGNVSIEEKRAIESGFTGRPVQSSQPTGCDPAKGYCLIVPIPGFPAAVAGPAQYIRSLYQFGLAAGALLAMAIIIYGGIKYTASAGNPSVQSDAKDRITSAIYGLILLLAATLILVTINPNLVLLKEPKIFQKLQKTDFSISQLEKALIAAFENREKNLIPLVANARKALETALQSGDPQKILEAKFQERKAYINEQKGFLKQLLVQQQLNQAEVAKVEKKTSGVVGDALNLFSGGLVKTQGRVIFENELEPLLESQKATDQQINDRRLNIAEAEKDLMELQSLK